MTLLEILKEKRQAVIDSYNETNKGISLKDYMNIVIWWFDQHPQIAKKSIKKWEMGETYITMRYIYEACKVASAKANKSFFADCVEMQAKRLNATQWYNKNFK